MKRTPIHRNTTLKTRTALTRGDKPLKSRKRLAPVGKSPSSRRKKDELREWRCEIGKRWGTACIICGRDGEPAHCLGKGAFKQYRTAPWNGLPRCFTHHRGPQGEHSLNPYAGRIAAFWQDIGWQLKAAEERKRLPLTDSEIRFAWQEFWESLTGRHVSSIGASD